MLFAAISSPADLAALTPEQIEKLIFPVGFYHTKAVHLKALPVALEQHFKGRIPDTVEELCQLPGVGRKTANLVVAAAFSKPAICVDVHVHRICNRLGLVDSGSPGETEKTLRKTLPERYWIGWNSLLVSYGQTVCTPRNPFCDACKLLPYCDRRGVVTSHETRASGSRTTCCAGGVPGSRHRRGKVARPSQRTGPRQPGYSRQQPGTVVP